MKTQSTKVTPIKPQRGAIKINEDEIMMILFAVADILGTAGDSPFSRLSSTVAKFFRKKIKEMAAKLLSDSYKEKNFNKWGSEVLELARKRWEKKFDKEFEVFKKEYEKAAKDSKNSCNYFYSSWTTGQYYIPSKEERELDLEKELEEVRKKHKEEEESIKRNH